VLFGMILSPPSVSIVSCCLVSTSHMSRGGTRICSILQILVLSSNTKKGEIEMTCS
jgi:hypothetical protein